MYLWVGLSQPPCDVTPLKKLADRRILFILRPFPLVPRVVSDIPNTKVSILTRFHILLSALLKLPLVICSEPVAYLAFGVVCKSAG